MIKLLLITSICFISIIRNYNIQEYRISKYGQYAREELVAIAKAEIGVKELSNKNDGKQVEAYLASAKLKKGQPWCAAFISWVFAKAGYVEPRTGWSPALFNNTVNTREILPGNVFGIWFPNLKRIAHVGMVEQQQGDWVLSIEGNTNIAGSREGDGVYRKRRHSKTIYAFADWLPRERRTL